MEPSTTILLVTITFLFLGAVSLLDNAYNKTRIRYSQLLSYIKYPIFSLIVLSSIYLLLRYYSSSVYYHVNGVPSVKILTFFSLISFYLLLVRIIGFFINRLEKKADGSRDKVGIKIFPLLNTGLLILFLMLIINLSLLYLPLPPNYQAWIQKLAAIFLVIAVTWMLLRLLDAFEELTIERTVINKIETTNSQKMLTHITIVKRIIMIMIIIIAALTVLMMFENVRRIGATLLASAGVIAAIVTFTAQKTLTNIFAGLQIAFAQPIRMHDAVTVENEYGTIEDINLTNVVIKLWDFRRLIVPISYFVDKPFQNWSRESDNLFGVVTLLVDYSIPIDKLRAVYQRILDESENWDGKVQSLQVSDVKEHAIELRFLMSAENASKVWDLRCEVREKLINYIQKHYPQCFPKYHILTKEVEIT